MKATILVLTAAAALAACDDRSVTVALDARQVAGIPAAGARGLVVMTRNVYPGITIESIMAAPPEQIPVAAAEAWGKLQVTNFAERAGALAAEIALNAPHVVGLQEIPIYRTQLPSDAIVGGTQPATTVAFDFLQILLDSLAARGAHYVPQVAYRTTDAEVPAFAGFGSDGSPFFMDIRYTDGDAILVRKDVRAANAASGIYRAAIPFAIGGVPLPIVRGWGAVDATVGGVTYRVVTTHLEDMVPEVQVGQAMELLAMLQGETKPIVLVGDFNSDALTNATLTYGMLRAAGFADVWAQANPRDPGATCCNAELLNNPTPAYTQRIDLILLRGSDVRDGRFVGGLSAALVGSTAAGRTASGLWPSDHAGVVARVEMPGLFKDR